MGIAGLTAKDIERELTGGKSEDSDISLPSNDIDVEYAKSVISWYYNYCGLDVQFGEGYIRVGDMVVDIRGIESLGLWADKPILVGDTTMHRYAILHQLVELVDSELESAGYKLPKFRWRPHQIGEGWRLWSIVSQLGWCMVMHLPRTGKTGTVLYGLESSDKALRVCIITTKNAKSGLDGRGGWTGFIDSARGSGWLRRHEYVVTTPHQLHKLEAGVWDVVVVDESHKIYSEPKPRPSALWARAKRLIGNARVIFVTATPHAQSINQLYWQLGLCNWSPFFSEVLDSF